MALARTHSVSLVGVQGHAVEIEADIENGLVALLLVGLPDTALREARDRIRAAIVNSREEWPQRRITVKLSPAPSQRGTEFDLGIAALIAGEAVPPGVLPGLMFLGELGLDGRLRPVRRAAQRAAAARRVSAPWWSQRQRVRGQPGARGRGPGRGQPGRRPGCAKAARRTGARRGPLDRRHRSPGETQPDARPGEAASAGEPGSAERPRPRRRPRPADRGAPRRSAPLAAITSCRSARRARGKTMLAERLPTLLPPLDPAAALK